MPKRSRFRINGEGGGSWKIENLVEELAGGYVKIEYKEREVF